MSDDGSIYLASGYDDYDCVTLLGVYTTLDDAIDCTERYGDEYQNLTVDRHYLDCDIDLSKWEEHRIHHRRQGTSSSQPCRLPTTSDGTTGD